MQYKKILNMLIILFVSISAIAKPPSITIQHWQLKNKVHVYFVRRTELPMLDVALIFSAGSSRDTNIKGIAAMTNEIIGEGAHNLSADEIAQAFEKGGARLNRVINRDMAGFTLRVLIKPENLNSAIANFQTMITSPTFPDNAFHRIQQQFVAQLKEQQQNPESVAMNRFYQLLYKDHPYASNMYGTINDIHAIKPGQLIAFYKRYYTGSNANLILVGDETDAQARIISERIAGSLPEGTPVAPLPMSHDTSQRVDDYVNFPSSQSTLIFGQVAITRENPQYFSLMVGNSILGGLPMSSILYDEVREKRGLAYVVNSYFDPLAYRGPFIIALQTQLSTSGEAEAVVMQALTSFIQHGPTEEQLSIAKKNMINAFPIVLSSNAGLLSALINIVFYHRPLNYFDTYAENINKVTCDDVKQAFQKNIDSNKFVMVVVG